MRRGGSRALDALAILLGGAGAGVSRYGEIKREQELDSERRADRAEEIRWRTEERDRQMRERLEDRGADLATRGYRPSRTPSPVDFMQPTGAGVAGTAAAAQYEQSAPGVRVGDQRFVYDQTMDPQLQRAQSEQQLRQRGSMEELRLRAQLEGEQGTVQHQRALALEAVRQRHAMALEAERSRRAIEAARIRHDDGIVVDPTTGQVTAVAPKQVRVEQGLRKEYADRTPIKASEETIKGWQTLAAGYQLATSKDVRLRGQGDANMVYGIAQMQDPGSVVRDQDRIVVTRANGLSAEVLGFINRLNSQGTFDDRTRRAIYASGRAILAQRREAVRPEMARYGKIARESKADSARVVFDPFDAIMGPYGAPDPIGGPTPTPAPRGGSSSPTSSADARAREDRLLQATRPRR